jgi:hypothetical protein
LAGRMLGFKNQTDLKNRSSPVLPKTMRIGKTIGFLVQNSLYAIWGKKIKNQTIFSKTVFLVYPSVLVYFLF